MTAPECSNCAKLNAIIADLRAKLQEVVKLAELQKADLDRREAGNEDDRLRQNRPERAPASALQLALDRIIEQTRTSQDQAAAETSASSADAPPIKPSVDLEALVAQRRAAEEKAAQEAAKSKGSKSGRPHGRRRLTPGNRPVETIYLEADEVVAHPERYELIGETIGSRVAFRPGGFIDLHLVRMKHVLKPEFAKDGCTHIVTAPLPPSVWPLYMADPSAIAKHVLAKYGDCLPLHRQERISAREGFVVPRSTQCDWIRGAYEVARRVTDAMLKDAIAKAFCIATDATSAPMRAPKTNINWHMFVLLADRDHVIFRPSREHTSAAVKEILSGYRGYLLADAATVFDQVYLSGAVLEVACWFHLRRYFWRGIATEPDRAYEALALIGGLFAVERACRDLPASEKTARRAQEARPWLNLLDAWVERYRETVDARGPVAAAIRYYENQRAALHRFLEDGRLRLDNNLSEQALRHLVVGRANWTFFANEAGLNWYACFRSLIASCALHDLNPQVYLEEMLRLAPHWPATRTLELSPKHWARTLADLGPEHREALVQPWLLKKSRSEESVSAAA